MSLFTQARVSHIFIFALLVVFAAPAVVCAQQATANPAPADDKGDAAAAADAAPTDDGVALSPTHYAFILDSKKLNAILALPECSLSKTNNRCKLIVDRGMAVQPPTTQMYSGQSFVVIIRNPYEIERYFLDPQPGTATANPDLSTIVAGFFTPLAKLSFRVETHATDPCDSAQKAAPKPGQVKSVSDYFVDCYQSHFPDVRHIYRRLEPFYAPDSIVPLPVDSAAPASELPSALLPDIHAFVDLEEKLSGKISAILSDKTLTSGDDAQALLDLINLQKVADTMATNL